MKFIRKNIGYIIVAITSLYPVVIWMGILPLKYRFVGMSLYTSIGQLTALVGMIVFAWSLILSTRLKLFEDYFKGMNGVYIAHHALGGISFILLMIHPLFLAVTYIPISFKAAALFLLPHEDWAVNLGIASLFCLMGLLILTYYVDIPYHFWKFTHKFLGLAFFIGGLHSFFITSDISTSSGLKIYVVGFSIIALILFIFKTVLGRFLVFRYKYEVDKIVSLKNDILEITMHPVDEPMPYKAGQFIFISFKGKGINREDHPFSLCSSPGSRELSIMVKSLGDYTSNLTTIPKGTIASIEGPFGRFTYEESKEGDQIWIAGGVGITPFLSMARTFYDLDYHIDLYYAVRNEEEAAYLEELTLISKKFPNFRVIPFYSSLYGRLTADKIIQYSGDLAGKEFLFCGPPPMMISLKKQLREKGVRKEKMHSEEFQMV